MKKIIQTIIFLFLIGCKENNLKNKISNLLDESILTGRESIMFDSVCNGYDSLIILPPYSNIDKIETKFKVNLSKIKNTNTNVRDEVILFVFMKNREVVEFTTIPPKSYSFDTDTIKIYSKGHSFRINKGENLFKDVIIISD
ncbi:MAG: hypothetical protein JNJ40_04995 [Bacteroidia bacterium]|nr:hypothetical protein [Bacteroidia bacterium]